MQFKHLSRSAFSLFAVAVFSLASCKKDDATSTPTPTPTPAPAKGRLSVTFNNQVAGQPIAMGDMAYTNAAGNLYSVDLLKYYVTNFTLVKEDGTERNFRNYDLIDGSLSGAPNFALDSVDGGTYTAVKFYIGVDSARNHTGAQDGDLDPINGMIWTWSTGYIFFKHEGQFIDSTGATRTVLLHLGTDKALSPVTVPVTPFTINGDSRALTLNFNLNSVYSGSRTLDFNVDNIHQSATASEAAWIGYMKANMAGAFTFGSFQ